MADFDRYAVVSTNFLFIFPRMLRAFRGCERSLSKWPLGQYQVLCQKRG